MNNRTRRLAVVGGFLLVTAALFYVFDPVITPFLPRCPLHALTGLNCPGCGSMRALHQLAHGHLSAAFALNPLAMLALPFLAYCTWRGETPRLKPGWIRALLAVVVLFGILRNIPAYPFTLLAPTT